MNTQLRRSNDKIIAGVCGGIAEYFNVDPVIVRLLFVIGFFAAGIPILIYPILWLVMPAPAGGPQAVHLIPGHPRPVEQWQFDPHTGERIRR